METKSLFQKLLLCFVAGLVCAVVFRRIGSRFLEAVLPAPAVLAIALALLVAAVVYAFLWHRREKHGKGAPANIFFVGAIRYGLAFDLAMFGFQKIFHLQLNTPLAMLDEPFSSMPGEWLTWSYFGYSYTFACTIAMSQIGGALLLLFNRTRMLGTIVLMPVMLNIILIDYFYGLPTGVFVHALILQGGLVYLLLLDYHRLAAFFLHHNDNTFSVTTTKQWLKHAGRLSLFVVPLLLVFANGSPNKDPWLKGKYTVKHIKVNGVDASLNTCADSLLTLVYFDIANECVFEFNGQQRRMYGHYDLAANQMHAQWHYPPAAREKAFTGSLQNRGDGTIQLVGSFDKDSVDVELVKMR